MSDIFISYAREDKDRAEIFANVFSRQGWSVWWDRKIPPGQSFDEMIENALHSARCVIVLWSKDSVSSRWVKTEAAEGAARGILIPILMDKVQIPLEFKRIEAADLSDWQSTSPHFEFDHLLETVAGILSGATSSGANRMPTNTKMPSRRWWKTMPGILAATGGVIVVTMLVVVLYPRVIDRVICQQLDGYAIYLDANNYHGVIGPAGISLQQTGDGSFQFATNFVFSRETNREFSTEIKDPIAGMCQGKTISFTRKLRDASAQRYSGTISKAPAGAITIEGFFLDENDKKYPWSGRVDHPIP